MGLSTEPIFKNAPIEADDSIEWKWLTDAIERFEELSRELEIKPLSKFGCYSRPYAIRNLGLEEVLETEENLEAVAKDDGYYLPSGELLWDLEDKWFSASEGLKTVRALRAHLESHPSFWTDEDRAKGFQIGLPYILEAFENVLAQAHSQNAEFHLQCLC